MAQTRNGDLLLNGSRSNGLVNGASIPATGFLARADSLGTIRWSRDYTYNGETAEGQLIALGDDGALVLGRVARLGSPTVPVVVVSRFDSLGNVGRQRIIGRPYSNVLQTAALPDGSYALAGVEERVMPGTNTVRADAWLLRLTASGDTLGGHYSGTPANYEAWTDVRPAPHNGLLLTGSVGIGSTQQQAWLAELDSLGRVRWQQRVPAGFGPTTPNYVFLSGRPLANGDVLVTGYRMPPGSLNLTQDTYQAVYRPNGPGASLVWERITPASAYEPASEKVDLSAAGELTIAGYGRTPAGSPYQPLSHLRLQLAERPYVPDLCQTPPLAALGVSPTAGGDSLRFVNLSSAGPRYAQLLRWRWDFGDGTSYDGPAPPPHRYAAPPGASTAVRLTVTNNLGCTATAVAYPFALATAAQRALQAQLAVFPNPAAPGGAATVRLPGLRPQPPVAGELLNALGQAVRRAQWPVAALAAGAPLGLAGLAPGVYTLRLRPTEGTVVRRVLVQ